MSKRSQLWLSKTKILVPLVLVLLLPLFSDKSQAESDSSVSSPVAFLWSGGVTSNSARVTAKLLTDSAVASLAVCELSDFSKGVLYSAFDTAMIASNNGVMTFEITNLTAGQKYFYALEINGALDTTLVGQFQAFPTGTASFTFAIGGDTFAGSNHKVFETIRNQEPLFFLHTGDIHYQNIGVNDRNLYRQGYDLVMGSPNQSRLYREVPIAYIWDDHDYGTNNSDSTSQSRTAARLSYQEYVPHYPLAEGSGDVAIYQAFTVGRVRFILTDLRSARSPWESSDDSSKTMMGTTQKEWFKQELLSSKDNYALIVWVSTSPWIGSAGSDGWHAYANERREIANFISDNGISNLCMIGGDAHMIAIDDGSNSGYATDSGSAFPVFHAASLDEKGKVKGGPYSEGAIAGDGQFGLMSVTDLGETITVDWSGRNTENKELIAYSFSFPVDVSVIEDGDSSASDEKTYPNPFSPSTTVSFDLSDSSHVLLVVYNIIGWKMRTLIDEEMPAGSHTISWDGREKSGKSADEGVYFYRIDVSGKITTKKMILLR